LFLGERRTSFISVIIIKFNRILTVGSSGHDPRISEEQLGKTFQELEPYV
jgi:hypothetical protein